ncbi:hypothetical protein [Aliarcobacter butzleri]|uniref:hypothetical protein n=1 Tax=Aliarcobacter butzleri TaxID=28197 RepID=UPI0021B3E9A1|nr:hypothetical protein [Aliarcobacter butzleri]MCT7572220.1 hypothetical protein [Aliarcobacter butzleri]
MKYVLIVFGALMIFSGFGILSSAKSAIHEIESFIMFLIASVLISSASIIMAIEKKQKSEDSVKD